MADDELQNLPPDQGFPAPLDPTSPYSGNRPASGARRGTPGEVLSQDFQGAQNAGDFLGLDVEFTAGQPAGGPAGSPLDLTPPPAAHEGAGDPSGYLAPAPLPAGDAAAEFTQAPSAFEFGEDLGSEEGEMALEEPHARGRAPLLVGAVLVAALGAGGFVYGPGLYSRFFGSSTEVARVTPDPKPARGAHEPTGGKAPASVTKPPVAEGAAAKTPDPAPVAKAPGSEPALLAPGPRTAGPGPEDPGAFDLGSRRGSVPAGDRDEAEPAGDAGADALIGLEPQQGELSTAFPDLTGAGYEWASEDPLELIWRGSQVPMDAVQAPAKTLMPRVGNVRVFTTSGDVFEGRLYAVGQGRVWIDAAPGRVGLDGERVERIDVLPPVSQDLIGSAESAAAGKRVRVRVPGGTLFGRVLKYEGEDVTLVLDDGGRVHVKAASIEELGPGRAIVVRR